MRNQLYFRLDTVSLPASATPIGSGRYRVRSKKYNNLILVSWPNGRPCHLANHWLLTISSKTNALETPRVYASQISHLLRYCSTHRTKLWDLTDDLFFDFTKGLQHQRKLVKGFQEPKRGHTHIRAVQLRCLNFLLWISDTFPFLTPQRLIGTSDCTPKITINFKTNPYNGRLEIDHPDLVSPAPPLDDKGVITEKAIQSIQDAIFRSHNISDLPTQALTMLKHDRALFEMRNTYIYERRIFMIRIMKLTGLRPEELIDIPLSLNLDVQSKLYIAIPTKKQGYPAPIRKFHISSRAALNFDRYLSHRNIFLDKLLEAGIIGSKPEAILLTTSGAPFKKPSMTKDFDRLCLAAGLGDVRSCLSMFRHRFITREIHILLIERFEKNPHFKIAWTAALRDDVCFIVAQKTGHKHPESLHVYFHEEHRLLTNNPDEARTRNNVEMLDEAQEALIDLKFNSQLKPSESISNDIDQIQSNIDRLYAKIFGSDSP